MKVKIYIDGSCLNQGSDNAVAGYGVAVRGPMSADLLAKMPVDSIQDSSRSEAKALVEAIKWLKKYPGVQATIYSDSEMVVKAAHGLLDREGLGEEKNFWKMTKDLFIEAKAEIDQLKPGQLINICWISREYNQEANALARRAVNALLLVNKADLPNFNAA